MLKQRIDRDILFRSLVEQKQLAYSEYKKCHKRYIDSFFIAGDGRYGIMGDIQEKIDALKESYETFHNTTVRLDRYKELISSNATDEEILTYING